MEIPRSWVDSFREAPNAPFLKFVQPNGEHPSRLHERFEEHCRSYGWEIYTVSETHVSPGASHNCLWEGSSRCGSKNIFVSCDHYSTCRPESEKCTKYLCLCELIDSVLSFIKSSRFCNRMLQSKEKGFQDFSSTLVLEGDLLERAQQHLQEHAFLGFDGMAGSGKTVVARFLGESSSQFHQTVQSLNKKLKQNCRAVAKSSFSYWTTSQI
ncbi:hypothetical protein R1sor_014802 [Riccia sorocarpa]|uniref:Uncharacterized protein n=1 Tax=Riccia sorocarpa TaxID=122646 RepID=A0ABD3HAW6_9MARC